MLRDPAYPVFIYLILIGRVAMTITASLNAAGIHVDPQKEADFNVPGLTPGEAPGRQPLVPICAIQGADFVSPYAGQPLRTQGVVHADLDDTGAKGFYIQADGCDGEASTSDGLLVYLGVSFDVVGPGVRVEVAGVVQENIGQTELVAEPDDGRQLSAGNPLPSLVDLDPPFDNQLTRAYFEALEWMAVRLDDGLVVGPTSRLGETWFVRQDLGVSRVFRDEPAGTGEIITVDDEGRFALDPAAKVGDFS